MIKLTFTLLIMEIILVHCDISNDFRLGIQLCDGSAGSNTGAIRYTPYFSQGGGWTVWAGDSNYYDPDGIRIGIFREAGTPFKITGDVRICIQLTDDASNSNGNNAKAGSIECTEWASKGGGWSDFAKDSNCKDFDAVRIKLDVDTSSSTIINNLRAGVQLSDSCTNSAKTGEAGYTFWIDDHTDSWTDWTGDSNFYDPDTVKVYLGAQGPDISYIEPLIEPNSNPNPNNPEFLFNNDIDDKNNYYHEYDNYGYDNDNNHNEIYIDQGFISLLIFGLILLSIITIVITSYVNCKEYNKANVDFKV